MWLVCKLDLLWEGWVMLKQVCSLNQAASGSSQSRERVSSTMSPTSKVHGEGEKSLRCPVHVWLTQVILIVESD